MKSVKIVNNIYRNILMDISMNYVDNMTLNYFINKDQYNNIISKNQQAQNTLFINDKKLYKKRILDLTKRLFRNEIDDLQLKSSFNTYVLSSINYLKFIDKKDIIQDKYRDISDNEISSNDDNNEFNDTSCNYLMAKENVKKIDLNNYVIRKNKKEKKTFPQKELIKMDKEEIKNKGLKKKEKKKNINNNISKKDENTQ